VVLLKQLVVLWGRFLEVLLHGLLAVPLGFWECLWEYTYSLDSFGHEHSKQQV
jgi:hypothetical protein